MENHFKKSAAYRALEQQITMEMATADVAGDMLNLDVHARIGMLKKICEANGIDPGFLFVLTDDDLAECRHNLIAAGKYRP